jgi:hypothetical protein
MRESYFASDVRAVHQALSEGNRQSSTHVNDLLDAIQDNLEALLADEYSPERDWRIRVASSLAALSQTMRTIGKPTPSVETLASEMSI